jgi:hypothetical protein
MPRRHAVLAALMAALAVVSAAPIQAAPLDPSVCEQLQIRLDELRRDGVEADMAMGPEAARTRLPIDRFNRIGTYLEIDEQLNFRCGLGKQRINLPTAVEGGEEEVPAAPGEAAAPNATPAPAVPAATALPAAKGAAMAPIPAAPAKKQSKATTASGGASEGKPAPKAAKKAAPKSSAPAKKASTTQPADTETGQSTPAKKARPKKTAPPKQPAAKVDDAYRPPPKAAAREAPGAPAAKQ